MLVFAALISTSFTIGGVIADQLDPVALTFLRFMLATIVFSVVAGLTGGWARPTPQTLAVNGWLGLLLVVYFVTMFEALRWATPASTGAVFALAPLISAAFAVVILKETPSAGLLAGLVLAGLGAIWVMFDGDVAAIFVVRIGRGEMIFLGGTVAYAAYTVFVRRLHGGQTIVGMTLWTMITGTVLLGAFGWRLIVETDWWAVSAGVYAGIVWLAVASTAATFFLIKYASLRLTPPRVLGYTYLVPGFVVLLEGLAGHGWPGTSTLAGVLVTAAAMAVLTRI